MTALVLGIFALTYLLVASRTWAVLPIGRPGAALAGAVAMVAVGALSPAEAWARIDADTILLLFGMMLLGGFLVEDGSVEGLERGIVRLAGGSSWRLLALVAFTSGAASALLVNDTVCVFLTPLVLRICGRARLPVLPYLLTLATSANLGSALTLVGNPQNMLIGSLSGIGFFRFAWLSLPAVFAASLVHLLLLWRMYGRRLPDRFELPAEGGRRLGLAVPLVLLGVLLGMNLGLHMGLCALVGALVLILGSRRSPDPVFRRVDWTLLVFFAALFVVVGGLEQTGLVARAVRTIEPWLSLDTLPGLLAYTATILVGSNLVSNVPLVMLLGPGIAGLPERELGFLVLAFVSTVAGNLTLMGSVANLIVAELARPVHEIRFGEYLALGLRTTLLSLLVGLPVLVLTWRVLGS